MIKLMEILCCTQICVCSLQISHSTTAKGQSYVPVDFVVLETGGDERAPIILGWPFLSTAKAIIYVDSAKIYFTIKDKKEKFSFKNRILQSPRHLQMLYPSEEKQWSRRRTTGEGGRTRPGRHKKNQSIWSTHSDQSMTTSSLHHSLLRRMIQAYPWSSVWLDRIFHKTFYDIGSGVNIMSKVTYEYLFGDEPLFSTYMQL